MKHYFQALFLFLWHVKGPISLENQFELDQCCSCIELIAGVMREISSLVILYNYSIDDGVPRSSLDQFSNHIRLLICKWNMKSAWK